MKVSSKDAQACVDSFFAHVQAWGLVSYFVTVRRIRLDHELAQLKVDVPSQQVVLEVTTEFDSLPGDPAVNWEDVGRHEAGHLLVARLAYLAHHRHATERELVEEEEALVCKIEKRLA